MKRIPKIILPLVCGFFLVAAVEATAQKEGAPQPLKPRDFTAHLVGHAHIDLSWLWRWEETVHDIATNTFLGTLAQMDRSPGLTFAQSQAAVYEVMEKRYPAIFERIRAKVREGTWVPVGGMWAEPDLNMPDGESFARQLLYGKRYFLDKFGVDVTVGWNPDGFGHNFQLPQILSKAGIKYYVFERCAPENMPVFVWEGLDGSRLLAYVPPGWYLADLKNGVRDLLFEASRVTPLKDFMLLYGEGDHGGGPRTSDLEAIKRFKDDKTQPRLVFVKPEQYFHLLERSGIDFPVVKKELNFTFPACYTTQSGAKKANRRLENLLLDAERFSAEAVRSGARAYYPERDIDEAWKTVLRNQFHDILDGSSIGPVYEESGRFCEEAEERAQRALDFSLESLSNQVDTRGDGLPLVVYNSLGWERTDPVEAEVTWPGPEKAVRLVDSSGKEIPYQVLEENPVRGGTMLRLVFMAEKVPSLGYREYRVLGAETAPVFETGLVVNSSTLENDLFRVVLDPRTGWMRSLLDKKSGREFLAGEANVLQAIVDEPANMSAWELGLKDTSWNIGSEGAAVEVLESGPVRAALRVKSAFRNSRFIQDIRVYAGLPRVDCRLRLDWQERNIMIKAAFPAAARNSSAVFEIPYGAIPRPADGAEVPALKWIDLSDQAGTHGLGLLNDSKYGFDVKGNVLRISIVHGATEPDPEADRGEQELLYSLYPHAGGWKEAGTFRRGYEVNSPLLARTAMVHPGPWPAERSFLRVEPANVILSAVKKETGYFNRASIIRLHEVFGQETAVSVEFTDPVEAMETDLIERPLTKVETDGTMLRFRIRPFEIKTFRIMPRSRRPG
jgi:alpha-mannosidase